MTFIIVGCGRVGSRLATELDAGGHNVIVVDRDPFAFRSLPKSFRGTVLLGDGLQEEILKKAGVEMADAVVAVTQDDNRNIMAAQLAKHVFKVPKVVARIYDPHRQEIYQGLGLETVSPTIVITDLIKEALRR